ncbi:MAG: sulfatase [Planctomycetaceae bacterium]|nr:sulfatase [Planctomycetaceae bacterium]
MLSHWRAKLAATIAVCGLIAGGTSVASADEAAHVETANAAPRREGARRPNIVVIIGDDLGYGELGCYGGKEIPTPHLDSIANNGVRLTSGYVSCPVCSPTRAGFMTGRYQQRFGHEFNPGPAPQPVDNFGLARDEATLAERLKEAGYATGMVGKWHLGFRAGFRPTERGFDEFFGFLGGANPYRTEQGDSILRGTEIVHEAQYLTDAFAREAVAFIDRHQSEPFFLYLPFNAVHAPLQAAERYRARFGALDGETRQTFATMLTAMDDAVGAVLSKLRATGVEEQTLIVFFSDNGGPTPRTTSRNDPLRGTKATTWEGGIRVPFLVQWKGRLPAGRVDDRPVIALDIHPTALAAAGVVANPEKPLDGVNLLPYLADERAGLPHEALYWRFGNQSAIRMGDWKMTKAAGGGAGPRDRGERPGIADGQLFNVSTDLGETTDLSDRYPDKAKELSAAWDLWNSDLVAPRWNESGTAPDQQGAN